MSGPLTWWANRKSRIGLSPAALKPPHVHGKEWWTTPPIAPPQPEHMEYVMQFHREVQSQPQTADRDALLGRVSDWIRVARRLLNEQIDSQRGDLLTTDGLIVAAVHAIGTLIGKCVTAGVITPDELEQVGEVKQALQSRAMRIKRERAIESSKRAVRPRGESER